MPGGDRTGPAGMGPMTGRGRGTCAGYPMPGYANPMPGRGFGFGLGRGGGRGRQNWLQAFGPTGWQGTAAFPPWGGYAGVSAHAPNKDQEIEMLKAQAQHFEDALADIRKRIEELGSGE